MEVLQTAAPARILACGCSGTQPAQALMACSNAGRDTKLESETAGEERFVGLNTLDFGVIVAYLVAITLFGLRFRRRRANLKDYFLAGNRIPWWAISLSIVAAETSTLTIISVPGLAYDKDFRFLQFIFGYVIGRIIVAFLLVPHYWRGELITAYQLIERRFGNRLRSLTAG